MKIWMATRAIIHAMCVALFVMTAAFIMVGPSIVSGEELTIAAASDLNFALKDLAAEYEKKAGVQLKLVLGSSGKFFSQIQNGAPFDLYFSANIAFPKELEEKGSAVRGSLYRYAVGRIVVWVPKTSPLAGPKLDMETLFDPSVKKIAIANPKHAPYGQAAVAAMKHYQIYEKIKDKIVLGENIAQTAQFVESGAADVGIIALSLAVAPSMKAAGQYWEVPMEAHRPIEQGAVVLTASKNQEMAKSFLAFVGGQEGQTIMRRYGFILPDQAELTGPR